MLRTPCPQHRHDLRCWQRLPRNGGNGRAMPLKVYHARTRARVPNFDPRVAAGRRYGVAVWSPAERNQRSGAGFDD
eukprot:scaffold52990_cov45-Prasinocladus_malaysianus.AAC.1